MIIEDKRPDRLTIDDLESGDVFEKKFEGELGIYIKTNESWGGDDVKCVNLRTGEICLFLIDSKVEKLDAKLAVVGKGERT